MTEIEKATYRNILNLALNSKFISETTYQIEIEKLDKNGET